MAQDRFTRLIKIDKNGTKYYEELIPCPRCSVGNKADGIYYTGTCNGELIPSHVDNGVCFQCNGSGVYLQKTKEYTPEHEAELQKAREKRWEKARAEARAQAEKRNQAWLKKEGFDQDGNIWIILGDTYKNRDGRNLPTQADASVRETGKPSAPCGALGLGVMPCGGPRRLWARPCAGLRPSSRP